jgi:polyisoprenoid-binding protein YceI
MLLATNLLRRALMVNIASIILRHSGGSRNPVSLRKQPGSRPGRSSKAFAARATRLSPGRRTFVNQFRKSQFPLLSLMTFAVAGVAAAAPVTYNIDPEHTYPSFEADHMGLSIWRGKFNKTAGKVTLDKAAGQGAVDVTIDVASIDFGHDKLNDVAKSPDLFDVTKYPQATYKGKLDGFANGVPSQVVGDLTLHGVTRPVVLRINSFKCMPHPLFKREVCGADALGALNRDEFGMDAGKPYGFRMDVTLRIQVEAIEVE